MASTSNFEAKVLMSKGKRATAAYIHADCATDRNPQHLNEVLDNLLNPVKRIDEWETIDWCKWLMAGGRTPDEFAKTVQDFDYATTCGLVWTPNFIAYRCRTCGISPCMSLCTDCFKKGNHYDHDFNMFLSQAGGACDCGDTSVMRATGFCDSHGPGKIRIKGSAPSDLMCVAEAMMPRIILRLVQHLREFSAPDSFKMAIQDADAFLTMLLDFNNMGGLMRRVMATALTNPTKYKALNEIPENVDSEYAQYLIESKRVYEEAVKSLPNVDLDIYEDLKDYPALQKNLVHTTFLEELVFWTVKFEFPQKVVCLLLNMLPDTDFKEALTRAFVIHFSRISIILEKSPDPDTLSNRIVHVSVQLFSNEGLAMRMTEQLNLLHVMVVSLKNMMNKVLIPNTSHNPKRNCHYVVDCTTSVMKDHCYWPLVSDLNNVLSHRPIALKFMSDDTLLEMWFSFLSMYQGMNLNQKLGVGPHVEFEPNSYYAAFSAELEASAYPMWALVTHLTDHTTAHLTRRVLNACIRELYEWIKAVDFKGFIPEDSQQITFHLPLHRYLATFLCQGVARQGIRIEEILPSNDFMLTLLILHPLRLQIAFYEILNGVWVRNGLQIKGQAMTYIQCNFSNSMLDLDLYLLQICCTRVNTERFLSLVIEQFRIKGFFSLAPFRETQDEADFAMVENCLLFLATLVNLRTNLGLPDRVINRLEIVTILCGNDKTHSQLIDLIPERYGTQTRDFEAIVAECADYKNHGLDSSGTMQQGMYGPNASVWEHHYDPIHLLLRSVHRKDFQNSMDRYTEYCRQANKLKPGVTPWPPFKTPLNVGENYIDPRHILTWNVFQSMAFIILYKAVNGQFPEQVIAFTLFLLEQSVNVTNIFKETYSKLCLPQPNKPRQVVDGDLANMFETGHVFDNFRAVIPKVILPVSPPDIVPSPILYIPPEGDMGEDEPTSSGSDDIVMLPPDGNHQEHLMLEQVCDPDYSVADEEDMQLMLYTNPTNSIDEVRSVPESPVEIISPSRALLPPSAESAAAAMEVDDRTVAIPGDRTLARQSQDGTDHSVPTTICNYPALLAGTELTKSNSPDSSRLVPLRAQSRQSRPSTGEGFAFPSTSQGFSRRRHSSRPKKPQTELPPESQNALDVEESIISLLLKLHSKLSGIPDSFDPDDEEIDYLVPDDKVPCGDGPFYIGKLLKKIAISDKACYNYIQRTREEIWPSKEEKEKAKQMRQNKEREDRRRRAKERQEKLMAEFAAKQREFLKREQERMETDERGESMDQSNISISKQEYDCAICNISSPSTEEMPMGLVAVVRSTSVIGHRRKYGHPEGYMLPTSDDEKERVRKDDTLSAEFERKVEELNRHFDPESWFMAVNTGWDGGVHVHTCGHYLHLHCLNSYVDALLQSQTQQPRLSSNLAPDKGEFLCPVCRQLGTTVLPVSSQYGDKAQIVRTRTNKGMMQILEEIGDFLKDNEQKPNSSPMAEAKGKVMEMMANSTQIKPLFKSKNDTPVPQSLFLFFTSIARTNLEVELVQRYGSLVKLPNDPPNLLLPKRNCVVQLFDILGAHSRVSTSVTRWPACTIFRQLCGLPPPEPATSLAPIEREVPFLLKDPTALLLQFVLLLPLQIDQIYFTATVQMMYNLLYYQVVAQISCGLTSCERASAANDASRDEFRNFVDALGLVTECLGHTELYMDDGDLSESGLITDDDNRKINIVALEQQVQRLCLPFLRIASLLKFHLYNHPLPDIPSPQSEFVRLVYYLELVTESMDWKCFNASVALNWPRNSDLCRSTPRLWCNEFAAFVTKSQIAARSFLMDQSALWHSPRLLTLPTEYERIFTYYHERPCNQCHSVAQETSICLLCGTIVCMKQNCCKQQNVCEAVAHAQECGAGTAPFLVVTSTYVIVIRGPRACLWGSLYLDVFEEEDKDLKRGKPLYLCEDRFRLLQQQWLAHRFEHTKKAWILHRNAL